MANLVVDGDTIQAQHWRFVWKSLRKPQNKTIEISAIYFYDAAGSEISFNTAAFSNPGGKSPGGDTTEHLRKGTNKWLDFNMKPLVISFDKPTGVKSFAFRTGSDAPERDPMKFQLEASDDNKSWTPVCCVSREPCIFTKRRNELGPRLNVSVGTDPGLPAEFDPEKKPSKQTTQAPNPASPTRPDLDVVDLVGEGGTIQAQHWKFQWERLRTGHNRTIQISAITFYDPDGRVVSFKSVSFANPGGRSPGGEKVGNLRTGDSKWLDFNMKPVVISFEKPTMVASFALRTGNDAIERDPQEFSLHASNTEKDWVPVCVVDVGYCVLPERRSALGPRLAVSLGTDPGLPDDFDPNVIPTLKSLKKAGEVVLTGLNTEKIADFYAGNRELNKALQMYLSQDASYLVVSCTDNSSELNGQTSLHAYKMKYNPFNAASCGTVDRHPDHTSGSEACRGCYIPPVDGKADWTFLFATDSVIAYTLPDMTPLWTLPASRPRVAACPTAFFVATGATPTTPPTLLRFDAAAAVTSGTTPRPVVRGRPSCRGGTTSLAVDYLTRFVATGGSDGTVWIHDAVSLAPLTCLREHTQFVNAVKFSEAGRNMLTCDFGGQAVIWSCEDWGIVQKERPRTQLSGLHPTGAHCGLFSADGNQVAIELSYGGSWGLFDIATFALAHQDLGTKCPIPLPTPELAGSVLTMHQDTKTLAFYVPHGTVRENEAAIKTLLMADDTRWDLYDEQSMTPLHCLALCDGESLLKGVGADDGAEDKVQVLVKAFANAQEKGAASGFLSDRNGPAGMTPLMTALTRDNGPFVDAYIRLGWPLTLSHAAMTVATKETTRDGQLQELARIAQSSHAKSVLSVLEAAGVKVDEVDEPVKKTPNPEAAAKPDAANPEEAQRQRSAAPEEEEEAQAEAEGGQEEEKEGFVSTLSDHVFGALQHRFEAVLIQSEGDDLQFPCDAEAHQALREAHALLGNSRDFIRHVPLPDRHMYDNSNEDLPCVHALAPVGATIHAVRIRFNAQDQNFGYCKMTVVLRLFKPVEDGKGREYVGRHIRFGKMPRPSEVATSEYDELIPLEDFGLCPMPIGGIEVFARVGGGGGHQFHLTSAFAEFHARIPPLLPFLFVLNRWLAVCPGSLGGALRVAQDGLDTIYVRLTVTHVRGTGSPAPVSGNNPVQLAGLKLLRDDQEVDLKVPEVELTAPDSSEGKALLDGAADTAWLCGRGRVVIKAPFDLVAYANGFELVRAKNASAQDPVAWELAASYSETGPWSVLHKQPLSAADAPSGIVPLPYHIHVSLNDQPNSLAVQDSWKATAGDPKQQVWLLIGAAIAQGPTDNLTAQFSQEDSWLNPQEVSVEWFVDMLVGCSAVMDAAMPTTYTHTQADCAAFYQGARRAADNTVWNMTQKGKKEVQKKMETAEVTAALEAGEYDLDVLVGETNDLASNASMSAPPTPASKMKAKGGKDAWSAASKMKAKAGKGDRFLEVGDQTNEKAHLYAPDYGKECPALWDWLMEAPTKPTEGIFPDVFADGENTVAQQIDIWLRMLTATQTVVVAACSNFYTRGVVRSLEDMAVIHMYTLEAPPIYRPLNKVLRLRDPEGIARWRPFIYKLQEACLKLPPCSALVWRGISAGLKFESLTINARVTWCAFTSTSLSRDAAVSFFGEQGVMFRALVFGARDISLLSKFPEEAELLLPANSLLKSTGLYKVNTAWTLTVPLDMNRFTDCDRSVVCLNELGPGDV